MDSVFLHSDSEFLKCPFDGKSPGINRVSVYWLCSLLANHLAAQQSCVGDGREINMNLCMAFVLSFKSF